MPVSSLVSSQPSALGYAVDQFISQIGKALYAVYGIFATVSQNEPKYDLKCTTTDPKFISKALEANAKLENLYDFLNQYSESSFESKTNYKKNDNNDGSYEVTYSDRINDKLCLFQNSPDKIKSRNTDNTDKLKKLALKSEASKKHIPKYDLKCTTTDPKFISKALEVNAKFENMYDFLNQYSESIFKSKTNYKKNDNNDGSYEVTYSDRINDKLCLFQNSPDKIKSRNTDNTDKLKKLALKSEASKKHIPKNETKFKKPKLRKTHTR